MRWTDARLIRSPILRVEWGFASVDSKARKFVAGPAFLWRVHPSNLGAGFPPKILPLLCGLLISELKIIFKTASMGVERNLWL